MPQSACQIPTFQRSPRNSSILQAELFRYTPDAQVLKLHIVAFRSANRFADEEDRTQNAPEGPSSIAWGGSPKNSVQI